MNLPSLASLFLLAHATFAESTHPVARARHLPELRSLTAPDGTTRAYAILGNEAGQTQPLVFVVGKGETIYRHLEFAEEMRARGYGPIYILEHRGQGFSPRGIPAKPLAVHVESFDQYVDDFLQFMDGPLKSDLATRGAFKKPFLVTHSMGGTIVDLALRRRPDLADKVAHIAPLFEINFGPLPQKPLKVLADALCFAGCGAITVGRKPGEPRYNLATSDLLRERVTDQIEHSLNLDATRTSVGWTRAALTATQEIKRGPKPLTRTVIFQGEYEKIVKNSALYEYACAAEHCSLAELPGAHALHQERDPVRRMLGEKMDEFFRTGALTPAPPSCREFFRVLLP